MNPIEEQKRKAKKLRDEAAALIREAEHIDQQVAEAEKALNKI